MEITDRFYTSERPEWRRWLAANHDQASEVWLVSFRKSTGRPSLDYADAVEEALCFGWIDSTRKSLDEERWAQRYTPRRDGAPYSQANLERLAVLARDGRVLPSVLEEVGKVRPEEYQIPDDILQALRENPRAWDHWLRFSPAYRRIRAAYVDTARARGEEFQRRLANLVRKTEQGRQFGYGIERFFVDE